MAELERASRKGGGQKGGGKGRLGLGRVVWKAAFKVPQTVHTRDSSPRGQAVPAVCWRGTLDLQEGTGLLGLGGPSVLGLVEVAGRRQDR